MAEAPGLWQEFDEIERLAAGAKALLARRVEESNRWRSEGDRSAAHYLARKAGSSVGAAKAALDTSKRLAALPHTADAVRAGQLSTAQADAVADAAAVNPQAEGRLLLAARRRTLGELREACARTKAAADRDAEARYARIHAERACRRRTTVDGTGEILYRSTVDEVAEVWSAIQAHANRAFERARVAGHREGSDAYAADGLLALARSGGGGVRAPKVIVRIDWDALVRGYPIEDEISEIAGVGAVPVSLIRTLVGSGDAFLAAVVTRGVDVATVAHLGRRPTAFQRSALEWLGLVCTREGCGSTDVQIDHRDDWAATKITALWLLDPLCRHDHKLKTYEGWALVPGVGKRPFVPPDDPRHPATRAIRPRNDHRPPPEAQAVSAPLRRLKVATNHAPFVHVTGPLATTDGCVTTVTSSHPRLPYSATSAHPPSMGSPTWFQNHHR